MSYLSTNKAILLTSTVLVNSNFLSITDCKLRLQQYISAIEFYLSKLEYYDCLVICDNSDFDFKSVKELNELLKLNANRVEFLNFKSSPEVLQRGKGFGEGETIKFALENSKFLSSCDFFLKITGRIIISNIIEILLGLNSTDKLVCIPYSFRYLLLHNKNLGLDTRIIGFNRIVFINLLMESYCRVNDVEGNYFECILFNDVARHNIKINYFQNYPLFKGLSGSTGKSYKESNMKIVVKKLLLFLLNWNRQW